MLVFYINYQGYPFFDGNYANAVSAISLDLTTCWIYSADSRRQSRRLCLYDTGPAQCLGYHATRHVTINL